MPPGRARSRWPPRRRGAVVVRAGPWASAAASGLADLEPREPGHRDAGLLEHLGDSLLRLAHRRLLEQHDVFEEALDAPFDDLRQRLLRLALLASGRLGDLALLGHRLDGDVVAAEVLRRRRARD